MRCHKGCYACCVVISISSPLPGLPSGKAAGMRCPHLNTQNLCVLYDKPERPAICSHLQPAPDTCGSSKEEAFALLAALEAYVTS